MLPSLLRLTCQRHDALITLPLAFTLVTFTFCLSLAALAIQLMANVADRCSPANLSFRSSI